MHCRFVQSTVHTMECVITWADATATKDRRLSAKTMKVSNLSTRKLSYANFEWTIAQESSAYFLFLLVVIPVVGSLLLGRWYSRHDQVASMKPPAVVVGGGKSRNSIGEWARKKRSTLTLANLRPAASIANVALISNDSSPVTPFSAATPPSAATTVTPISPFPPQGIRNLAYDLGEESPSFGNHLALPNVQFCQATRPAPPPPVFDTKSSVSTVSGSLGQDTGSMFPLHPPNGPNGSGSVQDSRGSPHGGRPQPPPAWKTQNPFGQVSQPPLPPPAHMKPKRF